jgi:hypothetical protein
MINEQFKNAIKEIYSALESSLCPWAIIGSTNLALQGMDVNPRDLDLVMRLGDLRIASQKFQKYNPSEIKELFPDSKDPAWTAKLKKCPAYDIHFNIGDVKVQILGERNNGDYVNKLRTHQLTYVSLKGSQIPCLTLEAEAQAYEDTHRPEKDRRVRDFLSSA